MRRNEQGAVFVRDVATIVDGADITTAHALANGLRTVYLPVTKRGDASTLAVVDLVKQNIPEFQKILPDDIKVSYVFDQPLVRYAPITSNETNMIPAYQSVRRARILTAAPS